MLESCCTPQMEEYWLGFIDSNNSLFKEDTLQRFLDVFSSFREEYLPNQIQLFLKIMSLPNFSEECMRKMMINLKKNSEFFKVLCHNEVQFIVFCKKFFHIYNKYPNTLKSTILFSLVKKIDDQDLESLELLSILQKSLILSMNTGTDKFLHKFMLEYILERQFSSKRLCKEFLPNIKGLKKNYNSDHNFFLSFSLINPIHHGHS